MPACLQSKAHLIHVWPRTSNDNDNDTLKEVPHPSNEGLALQARVSGPWPHKKESVFTGRTCSLARCANTNCEWTECNAISLEMNSSKKGEKAKHKPQAIAVLNSRIIHRTDRTRRSQGARKPGGTKRLLLVPNFFLRTRSIHFRILPFC